MRTITPTPPNSSFPTTRPLAEQIAHARTLLANWKRRPETHDVAAIEKEAILAASREVFHLEASRYDASVAFRELEFLLPMMNLVVETLLEKFGQGHILVCGRDAELFHDALTIVIGKKRLKTAATLFPGSSPLINSLLGVGSLQAAFSPEEIDGFLASQRITREALLGGKQFVLFDTGFFGSIGQKLNKLISERWGTLKKDPIKTVLLGQLPVSTIYAEEPIIYGEELIALSVELTEMSQALERIDDCASKVLTVPVPVTANYLAAVAFQVFPHHHGPFACLVDGGQAEPAEAYPLKEEIDQICGCNPSAVNPPAAMLMQKRVIDYFLY